ncbi:MAG: hypothetical protein V2A54_01330 [Bacteroidota bacterium]
MLQRILYIIIFSFSILPAFSQEEDSKFTDNSHDIGDRTLLYRHETTGGLMIHNEGWGFLFRKGKQITASRKRMYEIDLVGMKHPKEIKRAPLFNDARSYIYGKMNSFAILRGGIGQQKVLNFSSDRNGIEVRYLCFGGLSLGLSKPMYLYIMHNSSGEYLPVVEKYDPDIHDLDNIYGRGPFYKGFSELNLHPGLYAKMGLSFEFATEDSFVKLLEAGVIADGYLKNIPIMAYAQNKNLFFSFYLAFYLGGKK